ncbi:type IV pilus modification PilV family protein [Pararhizobium sp.]|uniref:type IV pilus modification PilV family protein n=1 Tax=Pararhizobium sp. TaxID=1977563 RepID=UPI003BAC6375
MRSEDDSGFSLLEVLVAFVILSAALVAANQSLSYSFRSFASAKTARATDRVAEEIFAERLLLSNQPSEEEDGVTSNGFKWSLKREPLSLGQETSEITAEKLILDVSSQADGRAARRYVSYGLVPSRGAGDAP